MRQRNKIISAVVSLILLSTVLMATAETWWVPGTRTKVAITNEVGGGRQLTVHCSRFDDDNNGDDLGVHVVNPHDSYRFKFPRKWRPAWVYCSMDWGVGGPRWFDIYDQERDEHLCRLTTF
ncbi:unnamed protein product [Linum trigynum]|uniref:S-protein homolog n=1 Tax=Linum trigynum TaxID=586398 RepID=A0AAV2CE93_9ROSI